MKKILLLIVIVISLTACGNAKQENNLDNTSQSNTTNITNTSNGESNEKVTNNTKSSNDNTDNAVVYESFFSEAEVRNFESPAEVGEVAKINCETLMLDGSIPAAVKILQKLTDDQTQSIIDVYNENGGSAIDGLLTNTETSKWRGGAILQVDFGDYIIPEDSAYGKTYGFSDFSLRPLCYPLIALSAKSVNDFLYDSDHKLMNVELVSVDNNNHKSGEKVGIINYVILYQLPNDFNEDYVILDIGATDCESFIKLPAK